MTEAAQRLADAYGTRAIELSVAGSQVLVAQVREGAPLDVILTADAATAATLTGLGVVQGETQAFARNRLAIAVAEGNPLGIAGLGDLAGPGVTLVLAAPDVPAGRYTAELLHAAGITLSASSLEPSVRAVLTKVQLGEADAGIVYRTDLARPGITGIEIPREINPITEYFAAALTTARDPVAASAFVAYLATPAAQNILAELGFSS
jgi:molybdate transport system substrate-binding protein